MNLSELLVAADSAYYGLRPALLSDSEYDRLARQAGHQAFCTAELPSLNNAICENEFWEWLDRIPAADHQFYVEPKIDGCSVLVEYRDGIPVRARTRKMEVPVEILMLPGRPAFTGSARGEAWHPGGRAYAAGRLRACDASAGLRWMPFCESASERKLWPDQCLISWHLSTADPHQLLAAWSAWRAGQVAPEAPTDGIVVKLGRPEARRRMGSTKRAPRWALALK